MQGKWESLQEFVGEIIFELVKMITFSLQMSIYKTHTHTHKTILNYLVVVEYISFKTKNVNKIAFKIQICK